jgi:phenylacetate-CoA ligase
MHADPLTGEIGARRPAAILGLLHPVRLADRLHASQLRHQLLHDLARIWCGQERLVAARRRSTLQEVLRYVHRAIPYYRRQFELVGIREPVPEDLGRLPLLDKSLIRQHAADMHPAGWQRHGFYRQKTGGSAGDPLEFVVDNLAGVAADTHQEFAFRLLGYREGDRIAAFAGLTVPKDARARNIYWIPRPVPTELPYGSICYATHYMSERTLPFYFDDIDRAGYRFILGYPSAVHTLARYCLDTGRRLSRPISAVQLTSEVVLEEQVEDIEAAFETRVFLQYGHSEACFYAHTVNRGHQYLCSPLMGWVEVLDDHRRQVATGEEGEVVVTGFHNRVMPFIRYRTGDRAVYGGERDGIVVLKQVSGRSQDFLTRRDGTKVSVTGLVAQHFEAFAHSERWQIVQAERGKVFVLVIARSGFTDADRAEIVEKLHQLAEIEAEVQLVTELPRTGRGKHLFFINRMPN